MFKDNQQTQHNECLICGDNLDKEYHLVRILKPLPICHQCILKFELLNLDISFYNHPLHILYYYNDFFKTVLFQYKGLYDYALKDAFLCLFQDELIRKYNDYEIVVAPSSVEDNEIRGFAPIQSIAQCIFSHVFTGLYKKEKYKQSDLRYEERKTVKNKIGINNGDMLKGKKVLILDDVMTSGSTLLTCLSLVLQQEPYLVELLVLSTKKSVNELRFEEGR